MPTPIEVFLDPVSLVIIALYALMMLLEYLFPARQLPKVRRWMPKTLLFFVAYFLVSVYLPLFWDKHLAQYQLIDLSELNVYASTLIAVVVFELMIYIWHRTMHNTHWLWRSFHQLHHSAERLDTFGAFYLSPLDMIGFTFVGSLSLTLILGIQPQAVTYFLYITTFLVIFQHTNIRTPQWLGYIIQRPESHTVHHGRGIHAYNYSDLPIFDIIFGTFKNPKTYEGEVGFFEGSSTKLKELLTFKDIYQLNLSKIDQDAGDNA